MKAAEAPAPAPTTRNGKQLVTLDDLMESLCERILQSQIIIDRSHFITKLPHWMM